MDRNETNRVRWELLEWGGYKPILGESYFVLSPYGDRLSMEMALHSVSDKLINITINELVVEDRHTRKSVSSS